jgi:O-antigen ligase
VAAEGRHPGRQQPAEWLFGHGEGSDWIVSEVWWWSAKDSHNDFIRLLNQQGLVGLGLVLAMLVTWAGVFPPGVAAPLLAALAASTAFSNGIMFRPRPAW